MRQQLLEGLSVGEKQTYCVVLANFKFAYSLVYYLSLISCILYCIKLGILSGYLLDIKTFFLFNSYLVI